MFKPSKELKGEPDKYINGYGPEEEEEEEEENVNKKEDIEDIEDIEEIINKIEKLFEELELLNKKLEEESKKIDDNIEKLDEIENNESIELNNVVNLEGGALKNTLSMVKKNYPEIMSTIYKLVEHYVKRWKDVNNVIDILNAESITAYTFFNNIKDGMLKTIKDIEDAIDELKYEREEMKTSHLINVQQKLDILQKKIDDKIADYKLKLKEEKANFKRQVKEKNDAYNKLNNYRYNAQTGYVNIVSELTEKYNKLKRLIELNKPIKVYQKQTELNKQVDDVLDLVEELDKNALKLASEEGKKARAFFSQLIRTGNIDTSHKNLSYVDITNKEDGNRNEFLFKKHLRPSSFPNPSIEINRQTYYNKYDFETPNELIELKTSNEENLNPNTGKPFIDPLTNKYYDNEKSFYIGKDKIDNIIAEAKLKGKEPKIYWYLQKKKGTLSNLTEKQLNEMSKSDYRDRLYTLNYELDENTFTKKDLVSKRGNIKEETYMLKISDPRITKVKFIKKSTKA